MRQLSSFLFLNSHNSDLLAPNKTNPIFIHKIIRMLYENAVANQEAGITMLQNGDLDQALHSFRRALVEIRQCITESASHKETQGVARRPYFEQPQLSVEEQDIDAQHNGDASTLILSVALGDCTPTESKTAKSSNLFSFYNHAFVVGTPSTNYTRTSQHGIDHHARLTSVLLFNMALTYHRKGLLDGSKSLETLRKAIQVYQLCINMSLLACPGGSLDDIYVIQLASWNNMGHLYSDLAETDDAIRCRALLYQALFEDAAFSLDLMHGYPYASFHVFVVGSEVRRRGFKAHTPEV
jgi:tetratricopeptide (TPR) repeat protein